MPIEKIGNCQLPSLTEESLKKLGVDPNRKTEIERRVNHLQSMMHVLRKGTPNPRTFGLNQIEEVNKLNMIRAGEAVRAIGIKPQQGRGMQAMLARDMGVVHHWLGMGDNYTAEGWVRESMARIKRLWKGGINNAFNQHGFVEKAAMRYQEVKEVLAHHRLRQVDLDYITTELAEKGWYPVIRDTQEIGYRAQLVLDAEYARFKDELLNRFHLRPDEVKRLLMIGEAQGADYHRIARLVHDAGIDVSETEFWGYFPRIKTKQAEQRFNWKWQDEHQVVWNTGKAEPVTQSFMRSRQTNEFIVEDEVILDLIIRKLGREDAKDPLHFYKLAVPGVENPGIADVLNDRHGLSHLLSSLLQSSHPQIFEQLLDSHLLSKIPYSTHEVFEYLRDVLKFPFDNLSEVFKVDWRLGMEQYRRQLEHVAGESGWVNLMIKNVMDNNWGVTARQVRENPDFNDFIPIKEVINPRLLQQTFQSYNPMLDNLYVHPFVATMAKASQELQMSPHGTGVFARAIRAILNTWKQTVLLTETYVQKQVWQNLLSVAAGGGNILQFPVELTRFLTGTARNWVDPGGMRKMFDNKRKLYRTLDGRMLTERELYDWGMSVGIINNFEPMTGEAVQKMMRLDGVNVARDIKYIRHTLKNYGIVEAAGEGLGNLRDYIFSIPSYATALMNNVVSNAGVFTMLKSMTQADVSVPEHVLRSIGKTSIKNFRTTDEALEHIRHYFFFYDDSTAANRMIGQYVFPFWGFFSHAIPASIRHVVRHPSSYLAWQRLYALANEPVKDDQWVSEGTVDEWSIDQNPIYFKIPNGRPDGRDAYFYLPMESYDPIQSGLNWVTRPAAAVLARFGLHDRVMTTGERLEMHPWDEGGSDSVIRSMVEQSYPLWQAIGSEIAGEHLKLGTPLEEGATVDEFLGVRMSPRIRMWLETTIPTLGMINRSNPGSVFGTPATYDVNTGEWTLGRNSWAGVPRSGRDRFITNNPYRDLQLMGVKVYPMDVYLQAGHTVDSLRIDLNQGRKYVARMRDDVARMREGEQRARREREIAELEYVLDETRRDLLRFEAFMEREGLNPGQAYTRLRQRNIRIGDLDEPR